MDVTTFVSQIQGLSFGKKLPRATYVYAPAVSVLPAALGQLIQRLRDDLGLASDFNVLKFCHDGGVSFLRYPEFRERPHPQLGESVRCRWLGAKSPGYGTAGMEIHRFCTARSYLCRSVIRMLWPGPG